jgi:hypothetical protein
MMLMSFSRSDEDNAEEDEGGTALTSPSASPAFRPQAAAVIDMYTHLQLHLHKSLRGPWHGRGERSMVKSKMWISMWIEGHGRG